jgi:oligoendopeptidase F
MAHVLLCQGPRPYQYYGYSIFVARGRQLRSTSKLLLKHLIKNSTKTKKEKPYLINTRIVEIRGTIVRQTMFAEFEKIATPGRSGEPLTVETLRKEYRKLLDLYFGPDFALDKELELECLRIPHFLQRVLRLQVRDGLSAAIALSERVTTGGQRELNDYLGFLKGGAASTRSSCCGMRVSIWKRRNR